MTQYEIVHNDSNFPLVVSFQGMSDAVYPKKKDSLPYLYYNMFTKSKKKNNYIFFKDDEQSYYNGDYDKIQTIIKDYISEYNPPHTYFIGQSAGGFTAILVGELIGVDKVISIAPQINLDWYEKENVAKKYPRISESTEIPCRNLGDLQPFKSKVEYWRPALGKFDNYHFDFIDVNDTNLTIITFEKASHNIGRCIGKDKFKNLIMKSIS